MQNVVELAHAERAQASTWTLARGRKAMAGLRPGHGVRSYRHRRGGASREGTGTSAPEGPQDNAVDHLLGELEAAVMRRMWARDTATVRQILGLLIAAGRPLAYTTVMTVMGRLVGKGLLTRELTGKTHVYRAAATQEAFLQTVAARQVQALVAEFGDIAIAQFLATVNDLSPTRRRQLERLARGEVA